jgi:hypothetical protein
LLTIVYWNQIKVMKKIKNQNLNKIVSIEDAEEFDIENNHKYEKISQKKERSAFGLNEPSGKSVRDLRQNKINQMLKDFEDVRNSLMNNNYH